MENKCEGNENKIILGDFNITMNKMDRDGGNKRHMIYRVYTHVKFANNAKTNHVIVSSLT